MFPEAFLLIPAFSSVVGGTTLRPLADISTAVTENVSADIAANASADVVALRSLDARAVAPTLNFDKSFWIWTGEKPMPLGVRPFRKVVPSSSTKCPVCATIIISRDRIREWLVGDAASLIATILVDYSDSTTETIVTDNTWKTLQTVPPSGWTSASFNDSAWLNATLIQAGTSTPWLQPFVLPPAVNVTGTRDIWTNETNAQGIAPVGHRPFRKTITSPCDNDDGSSQSLVTRLR
ncbi:hypothetical protein EDD85DRAFT_957724 [Armillaria nabsnona]|nr:hypothetical protein EDD85DRAFT_957724 [Armillaria nabsnona]